jgi:hypothetical protein
VLYWQFGRRERTNKGKQLEKCIMEMLIINRLQIYEMDSPAGNWVVLNLHA